MPGRLEEIKGLLINTARRHQLDPNLVAALVIAESGATPEAVRFEPHYQWLYQPEKVKPRLSSLETEINLQKTSFGPMQIMGAVAREHGLTGWLTRLCHPALGLEYGCRHLAWLVQRFETPEAAVSAYNQGHPKRNSDGAFVNQNYVNKVFSLYRSLTDRPTDRDDKKTGDPKSSPPYVFSANSLKKLATCHQRLQTLFQEVIKELDCTIIEGQRSAARQQKLVAQGRSRTMNSKHCLSPSRAVDAAPYPMDWEDIARFQDFGRLVKETASRLDIPIVWGGDWQNFKDYVHFQLED